MRDQEKDNQRVSLSEIERIQRGRQRERRKKK